MDQIICKSSPEVIVKKLQEYIKQYGMVKGIQIVDSSKDQIIILVDNENNLSEREAAIWYAGYSYAVK